MNRITTRLKRYGCLLLCICLLMPLLQGTAAAVQDSSVVRVAWYPDSAYNITCENGERSGYGYEYQQSVAAYTGWTYDYIEANWPDSLNMLQKGEIDLMAGVSYAEGRAQTMLFSDLPMGEEKYYLYANLAAANISVSDLTTLNGKRIGMLSESIATTQFCEWETRHGLHTEHHQRRGRSRQDRQPRNRRFYLGRESPVAEIRPVRDHLVRQLGCLLRDQQKPSRPQGSAR